MFNIFKNKQIEKDDSNDSLNDELNLNIESKIKLKEVKMDYSNFQEIPFANDSLVNKIKLLYKDFESNLKRFLIINYTNKEKPLTLNEHDMLFKKFTINPNNEQTKNNYIEYCSKNDIKVNLKTIDNIQILHNYKIEREKNIKMLKLINEIIEKKTTKLENINENSNDDKLNTKHSSINHK